MSDSSNIKLNCCDLSYACEGDAFLQDLERTACTVCTINHAVILCIATVNTPITRSTL